MSEAETIDRPATTAFFRPRRLGHVNLYVTDYDASQKFYLDVVGFREAYRQPNDLNCFVSNGNSYHDVTLMDVRGRVARLRKIARTGLNHLAFELETEIDLVAGYRSALNADWSFDDVLDHDVAHSVYTADPDGNRVEIYADVVKDWRSQRHGLITKPKAKYDPGNSSPASAERNYPVDPVIDVVAEAVFHPKKASHACLVTENFDALVDFYRGFVGLTPFASGRNGGFVVLGGTHSQGDVTILRREAGMESGMHHFGCMVWDEADLDRSLAAAARAGIAIERVVDHPARRAIHLRDPDGIRIQFYADRDWRPELLQSLSPDEAAWLL